MVSSTILVVATQRFFYFHLENRGNDSQFDEHIFQMGWFSQYLGIDGTLVFEGPFFGRLKKNVDPKL